ncbi:MAG: hypothetical protein MZV70_22095 [Desulfobacterales bacterium]|nr:hypothetical protein [Desulfobacterales bacterium]
MRGVRGENCKLLALRRTVRRWLSGRNEPDFAAELFSNPCSSDGDGKPASVADPPVTAGISAAYSPCTALRACIRGVHVDRWPVKLESTRPFGNCAPAGSARLITGLPDRPLPSPVHCVLMPFTE